MCYSDKDRLASGQIYQVIDIFSGEDVNKRKKTLTIKEFLVKMKLTNFFKNIYFNIEDVGGFINLNAFISLILKYFMFTVPDSSITDGYTFYF